MKDDTQLEASEVRFRRKQDPHFSLVLKYLTHNDHNVTDVLIEVAKARFLPAALDAEGKLNRHFALSCIGRLKGYIYEIEQLAGIQQSLTNINSDSIEAKIDEIQDDEDFPESDLERPQIDLDQMFSLSKNENS